VPLGAKAVTVPLATHNLPELGGAQKATNFSVQLSNALETRQLYVVLNNVQVRQEPGVTYAVYLNVPTGAEPVPDDPGYVGMLNFFSLHGEHSDHDGGASIAFPATDILKALQQQGRDPTQPTVTLVPDGNYIAAAEPRIGSISLVSQPGTG
jgi:hypothetical protein